MLEIVLMAKTAHHLKMAQKGLKWKLAIVGSKVLMAPNQTARMVNWLFKAFSLVKTPFLRF